MYFRCSETLQETDSWFCPKCERKQQATKTISVWKYPPYLIIHLERYRCVDDEIEIKFNDLYSLDFCSMERSGQSWMIKSLFHSKASTSPSLLWGKILHLLL